MDPVYKYMSQITNFHYSSWKLICSFFALQVYNSTHLWNYIFKTSMPSFISKCWLEGDLLAKKDIAKLKCLYKSLEAKSSMFTIVHGSWFAHFSLYKSINHTHSRTIYSKLACRVWSKNIDWKVTLQRKRISLN